MIEFFLQNENLLSFTEQLSGRRANQKNAQPIIGSSMRRHSGNWFWLWFEWEILISGAWQKLTKASGPGTAPGQSLL